MNDIVAKKRPTARNVLPQRKRVALVAHDGCKPRLLRWAQKQKDALSRCECLVGTGTTATLAANILGLPVQRLLSGPLGGDQQLGAMISEGKVDLVVFFWDPLNAAPHDPDVKALLRLATLWNVAVAMNETTADAIIHSPWLWNASSVRVPDGASYVTERAQKLPVVGVKSQL